MATAMGDRLGAARTALRRDWASGVVQIAMLGFQGQVVVGSMVGLTQSVYLVQFGAKATILSDYSILGLPLNIAASAAAVVALAGMPRRRVRILCFLGCCTCLLASVALTFPPQLHSDAEEQANFVSHYFGILVIAASVGAKFRDYPIGLARVYLLTDTESRASENAYSKIFDVMVGNAVAGALMLSLLANPTTAIKVGLAVLQLVSTAVSLYGISILHRLPERGGSASGSAAGLAMATTLGAGTGAECGLVPDHKEEAALTLGELVAETASGELRCGTAPAGKQGGPVRSAQSSFAVLEVLRLAGNAQVWQLMIIEWCVGFIFTLNNQAAGTIYWSSVVGVSDGMRSIYIALEAALGGGVMGFVTTLYITRLYHSRADVSAMVPKIVGTGAVAASVTLALFGRTSLGALCGITSLYLYYFVFAWSNIEFLGLLDRLKDESRSGSPLMYMFFIKDIVGSLLNNLRNVVLMWLLASTGFYEPDCNARCESSAAGPDCVEQCHAESHRSISPATVTLVQGLYVVVTPGAYLLACMMMRQYARTEARRPKALRPPAEN